MRDEEFSIYLTPLVLVGTVGISLFLTMHSTILNYSLIAHDFMTYTFSSITNIFSH